MHGPAVVRTVVLLEGTAAACWGCESWMRRGFAGHACKHWLAAAAAEAAVAHTAAVPAAAAAVPAAAVVARAVAVVACDGWHI